MGSQKGVKKPHFAVVCHQTYTIENPFSPFSNGFLRCWVSKGPTTQASSPDLWQTVPKGLLPSLTYQARLTVWGHAGPSTSAQNCHPPPFVGAPNFDCGRPGWRGVGGMYVDVVRDSTHDENPHPNKVSPVNNMVRRALLLACAGRSHESLLSSEVFTFVSIFRPFSCC